MVDQHSWVFAMNNHPIESWDLAIPSLAIYCSLTKVPCGQWVHDFGTSGRMQLTYFGQNLAGVQRFHIRMASEGKSWVVARMDSDGNWMTNDEQALEVTLTPTILNVLARLITLETSGNAAIHSMQDSVKRLTERVGTLEEQGKQLGGQLCNLFNTINQHGAETSKKTETLDTKLGELAESLRALRESVLKDAVDQMSTSAEAATLRLEATTEQITRELEKVKEKM